MAKAEEMFIKGNVQSARKHWQFAANNVAPHASGLKPVSDGLHGNVKLWRDGIAEMTQLARDRYAPSLLCCKTSQTSALPTLQWLRHCCTWTSGTTQQLCTCKMALHETMRSCLLAHPRRPRALHQAGLSTRSCGHNAMHFTFTCWTVANADFTFSPFVRHSRQCIADHPYGSGKFPYRAANSSYTVPHGQACQTMRCISMRKSYMPGKDM